MPGGQGFESSGAAFSTCYFYIIAGEELDKRLELDRAVLDYQEPPLRPLGEVDECLDPGDRRCLTNPRRREGSGAPSHRLPSLLRRSDDVNGDVAELGVVLEKVESAPA